MQTIHKDRQSGSRGRSFLMAAVCFGLGILLGVFIQPRITKSDPPLSSNTTPPELSNTSEGKSQQISQSLDTNQQNNKSSPLERMRELNSAEGEALAEVALLIRELSASECNEAAKLINKMPGEGRRGLLDALARHWAKVDPTGAFIAAELIRENNDWRNRLGFAAGRALVASDPAQALERITKARSNDLRAKTAEWVLPALGKVDPRRAASYLLSNKFLQRHTHLFRGLAEDFGRVAPREAIAWAEAAAAQSVSSDKKGFRESLLERVWSGWAAADPVSCVGAIMAEPEVKHPASVYASVAQAWSRKDVFAAFNWAQSLPEENSRKAALGALVFNYRELGPENARELLRSARSESTRADYAARIADELSREDIHAALGWVQSLPEGTSRTKAIEHVFRQWGRNDPAAASQQIAMLPESKERAQLLRQSMQEWTQADPEAALAFIKELPAGQSRDQATAVAINTMVEEQPHKALEWYRSINDSAARREVASRLMSALIKVDQPTALALAAEMPAEAQPEALKGLVRAWASDQENAAGEWINGLPAGKGRDAAVKAYVSVIDGKDPALATQWAYTIDDPVDRIESMFEAVHRWIEKDKAAAANWVEKTELPEGLRPIFHRLLTDKKLFD